MNKITMKKVSATGEVTRDPVSLSEKLNYNISELLNQSVLNRAQLPKHFCDPEVYPDYIALNTEPGNYHLTPATALAFYTYDRTFDKLDGLYNAIYYNEKKLLNAYKEKYAGIPFVIAPDYSIFDDIWRFENESRLFKIRITMLWFVLEMRAVVIPNAIYVAPEKMPLYYSGLEECTVMCFSTKGHIRRAEERNRVKEAVQYVTEHFQLKTILVYSVCGDDNKSLCLFKYAKERGISIVLVDNTLRRRNKALMKKEVADV